MMGDTRRVVLALLLLLALLGAGSLVLATRWGAGISPDSIVYVGAARNLLAGRGLSQPSASEVPSPMTQFPPLYPVALALVGSVGPDPLVGARWLNVLLFGANIALVGLLLLRHARASPWLALVGAFLVVASQDMLLVHAIALSEPLFLFTGLSGLVLLGDWSDRPRPALLVAAASLAALAFLTRYAGAALVAAGLAVPLLLGDRAPRRRVGALAAFAAISCVPAALWMLRNWLLAGTTAGHELAYHPITSRNLGTLRSTIQGWLLVEEAPGFFYAALLLCIAALLIVSLRACRRAPADRGSTDAAADSLPGVLALFVLVYGVFLFGSLSFVEAHAPLNARILSPVFLCLLLLALLAADRFLRARRGLAYKLGVAVLCLTFAIGYALDARGWISLAHREGLPVFGSRPWYQSKLMQKVRALPPDATIYSNGFDAIYILTGRYAKSVPQEVHPGTKQPNRDLEEQLMRMASDLRRRQALLVWFDSITWRWYLPSQKQFARWLSLRIVDEAPDGSIYAASDADELR
jgi:hypothetical protein